MITNLVERLPSISETVSPSDFDGLKPGDIISLLLSTTFLLARIIGVVLICWGIYGIVTAKKDGDSVELAQAAVKLIAGGMFIGLPTVLQKVGIIVIS